MTIFFGKACNVLSIAAGIGFFNSPVVVSSSFGKPTSFVVILDEAADAAVSLTASPALEAASPTPTTALCTSLFFIPSNALPLALINSCILACFSLGDNFSSFIVCCINSLLTTSSLPLQLDVLISSNGLGNTTALLFFFVSPPPRVLPTLPIRKLFCWSNTPSPPSSITLFIYSSEDIFCVASSFRWVANLRSSASSFHRCFVISRALRSAFLVSLIFCRRS